MPPSPPADGQRPAKKGVRPTTWLIIALGAAVVGGVIFTYYKYRQNQNAAAATTTTTGTGTDYSGQIATLQTEIADLQSSESQSGEGGSTGSGGGTGGGTGGKPGMPTGVKATATSTTIKVTWNKVSGADSYQIGHGSQPKSTVTGTSFTFSGLTPNHTYTIHLKACNSSGCSANTPGPVVRTKAAGSKGSSTGKTSGGGETEDSGSDTGGGSSGSGENEAA